jgi:DNA modification methylase
MADILRRISEPGQVVCDPMAGGGTTGVVSRLLGRHFVGCEIDSGAHATALERLGVQEEAEAA